MNNQKKYAIFSAFCLLYQHENLCFYKRRLRCKTPLIELDYDEHNPMLYFHKTITTNRLTPQMVLNNLDMRKYNGCLNFGEQVILVLSDDELLYLHKDKSKNEWVLENWEDYEYMEYQGEMTSKQAQKIEQVITDFYEEYLDNPKDLHYLQQEYLDYIYC